MDQTHQYYYPCAVMTHTLRGRGRGRGREEGREGGREKEGEEKGSKDKDKVNENNALHS